VIRDPSFGVKEGRADWEGWRRQQQTPASGILYPRIRDYASPLHDTRSSTDSPRREDPSRRDHTRVGSRREQL